MIRKSKQINALDNSGMTAIHHLVDIIHPLVDPCNTGKSDKQQDDMLSQILTELINHNANVDLQNKSGKTPVMCLLSNQAVKYVPRSAEVLLNSVQDCSKHDTDGKNIMHYLWESNLDNDLKHKITQILLQRVAKSDAASRQGLPPVEACIVLNVIKSDCNLGINSKATAYLVSQLFECIESFFDIHEHPEEIIEAINQVELDVNTQTPDCRLTLMSQCCRFYRGTKLIEALLQQGANPNIQDDRGFTSLHWLLFAGKMMSFSIQTCYCFQQDIESEIDFQYRNTYPWDKLKNMIQTLRDLWKKIQDLINKSKNELLQWRVIFGRRDLDEIQTINDISKIPSYHIHDSILSDVNMALRILYLLLRNKADPNIMDKEGRSPLHYCAMSPIIDGFTCVAMQMLIDFGADVNLKDINGQTPLMWCAKLERTKHRRMNILIEAGANLLAVDYNGRQISDHTQVCIGKLLKKQFKSAIDGVQNVCNNSIA